MHNSCSMKDFSDEHNITFRDKNESVGTTFKMIIVEGVEVPLVEGVDFRNCQLASLKKVLDQTKQILQKALAETSETNLHIRPSKKTVYISQIFLENHKDKEAITFLHLPKKLREVVDYSNYKVILETPEKIQMRIIKEKLYEFFPNKHSVAITNLSLEKENESTSIFFECIIKGLNTVLFPKEKHAVSISKAIAELELDTLKQQLKLLDPKAYQESSIKRFHWIFHLALCAAEDSQLYLNPTSSNAFKDPKQRKWTIDKIQDLPRAAWIYLATRNCKIIKSIFESTF